MANSVPTRPSLRSRPLADLTRAVFGETMTIDEVFRRLESGDANADDHFDRTSPVIPTPLVPSPPADTPTARDAVWVGSTGYERHKVSDDFVRLLAQAGVERLIDVRELPISRRRGYAKTALADALAQAGIEYRHIRSLGNPKPYRDLYKSGRAPEGRRLYERYLLKQQRAALHELAGLLREKRTALMCVEHDRARCHRAVIFDALRHHVGLELEVVDIE